MNTLQAYAIFDVQSQLYTNPHFMQNDTVAKRTFEIAVNEKTSHFNKYPEDFSMFHIGEYNIQTATYTSSTPKQIANASQLLH